MMRSTILLDEGQRSLTDRGAVLNLVVRQFSLMVAEFVFYYDITFSSLLLQRIVTSMHLNEHESTGWQFEDKLKDSRTKQ